MNAAVDETSDELAEAPPVGPGARLKAARESAGMELERVAGQLHLKTGQVLALERDDYAGFAARVFVRGYLRNYARLLDLPVDSVMAMFDAVSPDPDRPLELKRVGSKRPQVSSRHGGVRMVSWALLLGIVALFFVWWTGYLELNGQTPETVVSDLYGNQPVDVVPTPGQLPLLPEHSGDEVGQPEPPSAEIPQASLDMVASQDKVAMDAVPAVELPPASEALPAESEPVEPELAEAASPAVAVAGPQVLLTLSGKCWVNIRDSSGTFKLFGEYGAGTRKVLAGKPPYTILLGNAPVASLTVDGQAVDLAPYTNAQVARLTLDPAAQ